MSDMYVIYETGQGPVGPPGLGGSILTTKGDLLTRDAAAESRLPVGADGEMVFSDSAETTGLRWGAPPSGTGDVGGPASSVDGEVALLSGVSGKLIKSAVGTGIAKLASGVLSAVVRLATLAELPQITTARLMGRTTAGTGDMEELDKATALALLNVEDGATVGGDVDSVNALTGVVVLDPDDLSDTTTTNKFTNAVDISKLSGIESGATADQTGAEIAAAIDIENTTPRTAFAAGDKLMIWESGVGNRQVDYADLPGVGGGLSNIVEDTTPQLGGALDLNGNNITAAGAVAIDPTEMSYLDGVSSNIQGQLDSAVTDADFSANGLMERTGAGTYSVATVTGAGKALLDDADASAQRTTLGLGDSATKNVGATSADVAVGDIGVRKVSATATTATTAVSLASADWVEVTLQTATSALGFSNAIDGKGYRARIKQDATGGRTITAGAGLNVGSDIALGDFATDAANEWGYLALIGRADGGVDLASERVAGFS